MSDGDYYSGCITVIWRLLSISDGDYYAGISLSYDDYFQCSVWLLSLSVTIFVTVKWQPFLMSYDDYCQFQMAIIILDVSLSYDNYCQCPVWLLSLSVTIFVTVKWQPFLMSYDDYCQFQMSIIMLVYHRHGDYCQRPVWLLSLSVTIFVTVKRQPFLMSYDDYCHCQMRGDYYHCKRANIIVITINVTIRNVYRVSQMTVYYPCLMSIIYPVKYNNRYY